MSENTTETNPCTSWCAGEHPSGAGAVHRVEIGRTDVGGETVPVVVLKTAERPANVVISGPLFIEIHTDDVADMAALLDLSGQCDLAALVRQAGDVVATAAPSMVPRPSYVSEGEVSDE